MHLCKIKYINIIASGTNVSHNKSNTSLEDFLSPVENELNDFEDIQVVETDIYLDMQERVQ